ncbi:MAG: hypothetical protein ACI3XI_02900 [Eubacteriales bacterium]
MNELEIKITEQAAEVSEPVAEATEITEKTELETSAEEAAEPAEPAEPLETVEPVDTIEPVETFEPVEADIFTPIADEVIATEPTPESAVSSRIRLANGETVIKEWTYATVKRWFRKYGETTLTLTDRRLVATQTRGKLLQKSEIPTRDIKSFSGSVTYKRPTSLLVMGIILILALIGGAVAMMMRLNPAGLKELPIGILIGAAAILALAILFIVLYAVIKRGYFVLDVRTYQAEGTPLDIYTNNASMISGKRFRVKLDLNVAHEVLDTFGAVLQTVNR